MKIIVLGGTGNIGAAVLRELHQKKLSAVFTYLRSVDTARQLEAETQHRGAQVDLSSPDALRRFFGDHPEVALLIHCAGVSHSAKLKEITDAQLDEMYAINVRSALIACQEAAARMSAGGDIVLLGAIDGTQTVPAPAHFAASQGALVGLTRALSKELGPKNIRVNLLAIGVLEGGISRELSPKLLDDYKHFSAMRRIGSPQEVARAVLWVALQNTYMTGRVIPVNGGL